MKDTYIKITEEGDDYSPSADDYTPSEDEIKLDNYTDVEYTSPYNDNYDDILDVGGVIEAGSIFDDR